MKIDSDKFNIITLPGRLQAWTTCHHEYRQRTVATRSRTSADCTTDVLRT